MAGIEDLIGGAAEKILENQPLEKLDILTKVIVTAPDGTNVPISQGDWDKVINGEITKKEALENAGWISSYEKIELPSRRFPDIDYKRPKDLPEWKQSEPWSRENMPQWKRSEPWSREDIREPQLLNKGGRIGYQGGGDLAHRLSELIKKFNAGTITSEEENEMEQLEIMLDYGRPGEAQGGRIGYQGGGDLSNIFTQDDLILLKEFKYDPYEVATWRDKGKGLLNTLRNPNLNQGGRVGFQTGGTTVSQQLQPDYIEALGKTYAADLTRQAGIPSITQATAQMPGETASQFQQRQAQAQQFDITQQSMGALAPQVAAQDPMQAAAYAQATDPTYGLGAYQPYTADARTAAQAATALTGTGAGTGAGTIASYMSPYQQDVIDTTMDEFDEQALRQKATQAANALGTPGAFGGGREGVLQAQYQTGSDRNRAALHAQMLQQGYGQAQQARQHDFRQQQALATQQAGLGTQAMGNVQRQIAGLGTLGATQQVQNQAVLDAQRQFAGMAVNEPQQRLGMLGQGVTGLMGGMQGVGTTLGQAPPQTSPLGTALGIGSTLAGIYGYMNR